MNGHLHCLQNNISPTEHWFNQFWQGAAPFDSCVPLGRYGADKARKPILCVPAKLVFTLEETFTARQKKTKTKTKTGQTGQTGQWVRFCWTHLWFALLALWGRTCSTLQCTTTASITTHTRVDGRRHISTGVNTRYLTRDRNQLTLPGLYWIMMTSMMTKITSMMKTMFWETRPEVGGS